MDQRQGSCQQGRDYRDGDPVEQLIDRVAEAVVQKLDERRKIDAIALAVMRRLEFGPAPQPTISHTTPEAVATEEDQG